MRPSEHIRKGFTLIELLVVIVIIGILAAIALPNYIKVKDKAKEAELKANLHNIQLSVERFAVDTEGVYPNYLIGGEAKYASQVDISSSSNAFTQIQDCDPITAVSDILLRRGYIDAYPRSPFTRNGVSIHQMQAPPGGASTLFVDYMRNGNDSESYNNGDWQLGTRFGPYCTTMGCVLADLRYRTWTWVDANNNGQPNQRQTGCNVEFPFWDMWEGNRPLPYLPGQFFYKGAGPIIAIGTENGDEDDPAPIPTEIDQYMMGGYGSIRTKGKDVLGYERPIQYRVRSDAGTSNWFAAAASPSSSGTYEPAQGGPGPIPGPTPGPSTGSPTMDVWPWVRSERTAGSDGELDGAPFTPAKGGESNEQLMYGNPNGTRDGLVLILTAGEDYIGDR